jgi:ABC-2 type transport system ATP-binding protein
MIRIEKLSKSYGRKQPLAISDVDFEVKDGEVLGFVGLNGAGKTTTIRVAVGVSLPTRGSVQIDDNDIVTSKAKASSRLGWVPEIPNFEPNAKALSLMKYFCGFYNIPSSSAAARSKELLASVGLEGAEGKKFSAYSQGMKKRFSLAVSLISDPQNYLFDEILNGLDPAGIQYFRNTVMQLRKEGRAILLSSHILAEVEAMADRVVFIHKGRVIKVATMAEVSSLGTSAIVLTVQNLDEKGLAYLRTLGEVSVDGQTVRLSGSRTEPSDINAELARQGYKVSQLVEEKAGLEEGFFKLIGEAEGGTHA